MNPYLMPILIPRFPHDNPKPPTIYALLNSIVNFGKEEQTKISELAKNGRGTFFDFQYPLSKVINKEERTEKTLEETVRTIFKVIKHMEHEVWYKYPHAVCHLADDVFFITSQELEDLYPNLSSKERENKIIGDLCIHKQNIWGKATKCMKL